MLLLHSRSKMSLFQVVLQKLFMMLNCASLFIAVYLKKSPIDFQNALEFLDMNRCLDPTSQDVVALHLAQFRSRLLLFNVVIVCFYGLFVYVACFVVLLLALDIRFGDV